MSIIMREQRVRNSKKIISLPVEWIFPNPAQPRRTFGRDELEELASSIAENGLLQPLLVRKISEKRYQLICGERRLMAVRTLKMQRVDAIVYDVESEESAVMSLVENIHRKNLTFFEEARAISNLINIWSISQEEAAKKLGKSQPAIANKLRLLRLPDDIRSKIEKNGLSERHARALLAIEENDARREALDWIIEKRLNVSQTEEYIKCICEHVENNDTNGKNKIYKCIVKDVRLFLNTINRAVDTMLCAGINAQTSRNESEDYIEYIVKIPKMEAYKKSDERAEVSA